MGVQRDHIGSYNFRIEIDGVTVAYVKQVQGLEGAHTGPVSSSSSLGARSPVQIAGAESRFDGKYYVQGTTHKFGSGQQGSPGGFSTPSQIKVVLLGVLPAGEHGSNELFRLWQQRGTSGTGQRPISVVRQNSSGGELRRHSMEGWLVAWQGPPPRPGWPDPPPLEAGRVELAAVNLRLGP